MDTGKKRKRERIVSIDFDGVLSEYDGWKGESVLGMPIAGGLEFILRLMRTGYTPVVFTVRDASYVRDWLSKHNFPDIDVTREKVPSVAYIDDRCVRFDGDFTKFSEELRRFDVYWRKKEDRIFDDFFGDED